MKSYQRLLIFGLVALAFTALLSPWAAAAWEQFISAHAGWEESFFVASSLRVCARIWGVSAVIFSPAFFFQRFILSSLPMTRSCRASIHGRVYGTWSIRSTHFSI